MGAKHRADDVDEADAAKRARHADQDAEPSRQAEVPNGHGATVNATTMPTAQTTVNTSVGLAVDMDDIRTKARLGSWLVPGTPEAEREVVDIDPNGDPETVEAQVRDLIRFRREQRAGASDTKSSEADIIASDMPSDHLPAEVTPPPRRSRRSAAPRGHSEASGGRDVSSSQTQTEENITYSVKLATILDNSNNEDVPNVIIKLIGPSPSIPGFLKQEIVRFLRKQNHTIQREIHGQSDAAPAIQDDGYLKTKAAWAFELGRIVGDEVRSGDDGAVASGNHPIEALVMLVLPQSGSYEVQPANHTKLKELRSDVNINPWFDAEGQPFSVVYRIPRPQSANPSSGISLNTQSGSQDVSSMQKEIRDSKEERDRLRIELESTQSATRTIKEQAGLFKQLYDDASQATVEAEKEAQTLRESNATLQHQLADGMAAVRAFYEARVKQLQFELNKSKGQLNLLTEQNRLMNDDIRRKAALWDAAEAKEEERAQDIARRQAKRNAERLALQESILGSVPRREMMKPHEIFMDVDLANEKIDVEAGQNQDDGLASEVYRRQPGDEPDEEDELAALQREAAQHGDDVPSAASLDAPRSRRSRRSRSTHTPQTEPRNAERAKSAVENADEGLLLASTIAEGESQARMAASFDVEDEFAFAAASALDAQEDPDQGQQSF